MAKKENNAMATSDFNMQKLTTRDFEEHVARSLQIGGNIAVFGRRGSGKTQIAKQQIKKSGLKEIYLNLSVLERVDLGGFPRVMGSSRDETFVSYMLPFFYRHLMTGNEKCALLLDEMDKADPSLWAPLLELVQFRSINGQELPNLAATIMTGNLISEGGSRPSLPLLDRAEKYLLEPDSNQWLDWAGRTGTIHPSVTAYINDHSKDLFGAVDPEDRYADPSPRGWERASNIISQGEKFGWSNSVLNRKVAGCVGKEAGMKYAHYFEHYQVLLPLVNQIFEGKHAESVKKYDALDPGKKLIASMIVCARMANLLDTKSKKELEKPLSYVGKFMLEIPPENVLVAVRSQIQIERIVEHDLSEHKDWSKVLVDTAKYLKG
jgi:hypothetical protein